MQAAAAGADSCRLSPDADGFQPRWDSYGRLAQVLTATVPTLHIEGNHEVRHNPFALVPHACAAERLQLPSLVSWAGACIMAVHSTLAVGLQIEVTNGHLGFLAYESRFYTLANHSGSGTPLYYSYEVRCSQAVQLWKALFGQTLNSGHSMLALHCCECAVC